MEGDRQLGRQPGRGRRVDGQPVNARPLPGQKAGHQRPPAEIRRPSGRRWQLHERRPVRCTWPPGELRWPKDGRCRRQCSPSSQRLLCQRLGGGDDGGGIPGRHHRQQRAGVRGPQTWRYQVAPGLATHLAILQVLLGLRLRLRVEVGATGRNHPGRKVVERGPVERLGVAEGNERSRGEQIVDLGSLVRYRGLDPLDAAERTLSLSMGMVSGTRFCRHATPPLGSTRARSGGTGNGARTTEDLTRPQR